METKIKIEKLKKEIEDLTIHLKHRTANTEASKDAVQKMIAFKKNRILELSVQ
jgi:hypothetical protein